MPSFFGGFGGGAGAGLDMGEVGTLSEPRRGMELEDGSGVWWTSLESWKVIKAVNITISRPFRSSMSNLDNSETSKGD